MMEKLKDEPSFPEIHEKINELVNQINELVDQLERLSKSYADHFHHIDQDSINGPVV